jgi:16S rRNA (guanine966-N2)-methyltransferase
LTLVRVVAGSARGRRLRAPSGTTTRPTSDRVREAVFASLTSMGAVEGAKVADLFAGSGAMGIEALSRGAREVVFVETDRAAVAAIEVNLDATGFERTGVEIVRVDALRWAQRGVSVDLAIIDPPYAFDGWAALLDALNAQVIVCESGTEFDLGPRWEVLKRKRYGSTVVTVAQERGAGQAGMSASGATA